MELDELKKESEEHCNEVMCTICENKTCTEKLKCREWRDRRAGYYCGAEPREKHIAELEQENKLLGERCNQLLADKGRLTDELDKWKAEWNEQVVKANEEEIYQKEKVRFLFIGNLVI